MNSAVYFDLIDAKKEEYYSLLEMICNIESNSADFEGVRTVCRALCSFAVSHGFSVREETYEDAGMCAVIEMNTDAALPPLMYSGHMDTVYERGVFGYPPVRREGDTLYGPGVADCKGGIVVALLAMDALKDAGFTERPLRLFLQCDEEVGSRYSKKQSMDFMIREAKECAAFLNCENARPGMITLARKGIRKTVLQVHGRKAHAKDYLEGASAVAEAAYKIVRMHEHSRADGPCFNCTVTSMSGPTNVVPDECEIVVDSRVATMAEVAEVSAFLHDVAENCRVPGTSGEVVREGLRPPMEPCEKNKALFDRINRICAKNMLPTYAPFTSAGGADASNVSQAGVPCVDSLGIEGEGYHTLKECCRLSSMPERAKVLAAIAVDFDNE